MKTWQWSKWVIVVVPVVLALAVTSSSCTTEICHAKGKNGAVDSRKEQEEIDDGDCIEGEGGSSSGGQGGENVISGNNNSTGNITSVIDPADAPPSGRQARQ